jgi:hypothetical protein
VWLSRVDPMAGRPDLSASVVRRSPPDRRTGEPSAIARGSANCGPRWLGAKGFDSLSQALRSGALETVPAALMLDVNPGGANGGRAQAPAQGGSCALKRIARSGESVIQHPKPLMGCPDFNSPIRPSSASAIALATPPGAPCSWSPCSPARSRVPTATTSAWRWWWWWTASAPPRDAMPEGCKRWWSAEWAVSAAGDPLRCEVVASFEERLKGPTCSLDAESSRPHRP